MKYYVDWKNGYRLFDENGKLFDFVQSAYINAPAALLLGSFPEGNEQHGWLVVNGKLRVEGGVAHFDSDEVK